MIRLRIGKSSIILGFTKILELALIDHSGRAIAINCLDVINIWFWVPTNNHKLLAFIFLVFPVIFCLIFPHSSVCSVRCLLMAACLKPILIHIFVAPMNPFDTDSLNCTGTSSASYHKVFEPCNQILVDMVGSQSLNLVWHYMQTPKYHDGLANWVLVFRQCLWQILQHVVKSITW